MTELARRQVEQLQRDVVGGTANPAFVVVDDGQSITELVRVVTGVAVQPGSALDGITRFRLSDYLPNGGLRLVSTVQSASAESRWIILHAGGTRCPPPLLELIQYVVRQRFSVPRFLLVIERLDLLCASPEMAALFALGEVVDLTAKRDAAYFRELLAPTGAPAATMEKLIELHMRILTAAVPKHLQSLRSLVRACQDAATLDLPGPEAAAQEYLGGLSPSTSEYEAIDGLIMEVFSGRTP